jgi:hypothetical protein
MTTFDCVTAHGVDHVLWESWSQHSVQHSLSIRHDTNRMETATTNSSSVRAVQHHAPPTGRILQAGYVGLGGVRLICHTILIQHVETFVSSTLGRPVRTLDLRNVSKETRQTNGQA